MPAEAVFSYIVIERPDERLTRIADAAADENDLRREDIDKVDDTRTDIGDILLHYRFGGLIALCRTDKRRTAIGRAQSASWQFRGEPTPPMALAQQSVAEA